VQSQPLQPSFVEPIRDEAEAVGQECEEQARSRPVRRVDIRHREHGAQAHRVVEVETVSSHVSFLDRGEVGGVDWGQKSKCQTRKIRRQGRRWKEEEKKQHQS